MNKTIEELQAAVEEAEANWMAAYAADAAARAAADAAWRTLWRKRDAVFDAREAAKTALAEKERK